MRHDSDAHSYSRLHSTDTDTYEYYSKMLPEVVLRVNGETSRVVISWSANAVVYLCNFPVERLPPHPCRQVHVIAYVTNNFCHVASVTDHVTVTVAFTRLPCVTSQIAQLTTATSLPALPMDAPLDEASTSDADERELLEAAHPDSYWDRVVSRSHFKLKLRPPSTLSDQGDDM